jgi:hypothetical protein
LSCISISRIQYSGQTTGLNFHVAVLSPSRRSAHRGPQTAFEEVSLGQSWQVPFTSMRPRFIGQSAQRTVPCACVQWPPVPRERKPGKKTLAAPFPFTTPPTFLVA